MKKITILLVTMIFLLLIVVSAQAAEEETYKGVFTGLAGEPGLIDLSYQLSDRFSVTVNYEDNVYLADLRFQQGEWFGIKIGERYDVSNVENFEDGEAVPYAGINFVSPFGTGNLRLTGYYDYNYKGKNWNNYEAALRIEMYKGQFLYAGIQGEGGDGVIHYDYNQTSDPLFFLRADFNWQWGKFGVNLQPLLYVTGYALYDTTLKYSFNDRISLVLNSTSYDDQIPKHRLGIEYKF